MQFEHDPENFRASSGEKQKNRLKASESFITVLAKPRHAAKPRNRFGMALQASRAFNCSPGEQTKT